MKVEKLSDLKKIIQLCRKEGITVLKLDTLELHLGSEPIKQRPIRNAYDIDLPPEAKAVISPYTPTDRIETPDDISDEDLLYYSSGAIPKEQ